MTTKEQAHLKVQIEQKILRLKRQIVELKELSKPIEPDSAIGRVSRMDAINNKSVNESALRKKQEQLKVLNLALEDIHKDDFGNCIMCGHPIPKQRIFIMPESRKCVGCAKNHLV
jgi:DnaK suppressor protein